jgi:epoxide hydrolase-like predicted phosphatase
MIKAICFDLDGVYFVNGKSNFIKNIGKYGVSEDDAKRVFLKSDEMNKMYKQGKMTDDEYWAWAIDQWKVDLSVQELIDLLIEGYEVNENLVKVVKEVRGKGYKTLICTNNFPARIKGLDKRFGLLDNFDACVFSYEVGATKPSTKIFQKLVDRSGVTAEEIVFADDNNANLAGAKEAGIQTFFYEGFEHFICKLKELGVDLEPVNFSA